VSGLPLGCDCIASTSAGTYATQSA
jgi:hypothetical protein